MEVAITLAIDFHLDCRPRQDRGLVLVLVLAQNKATDQGVLAIYSVLRLQSRHINFLGNVT